MPARAGMSFLDEFAEAQHDAALACVNDVKAAGQPDGNDKSRQQTNAAAELRRSPNILLIVGDDMGYADVGFHGCKDVPTPHLDALADDGVRFTNGYVSGPYCSPTRAGLLTGRYQQRFGHEFNPSGATAGLPLTETTLADRLTAQQSLLASSERQLRLAETQYRVGSTTQLDLLDAQRSSFAAQQAALGLRLPAAIGELVRLAVAG
mgnify:CR=1 FL=1